MGLTLGPSCRSDGRTVATVAGSGRDPSVVVWAKTNPFGVEFADITLAEQQVRAEGVSVGAGPTP